MRGIVSEQHRGCDNGWIAALASHINVISDPQFALDRIISRRFLAATQPERGDGSKNNLLSIKGESIGKVQLVMWPSAVTWPGICAVARMAGAMRRGMRKASVAERRNKSGPICKAILRIKVTTNVGAAFTSSNRYSLA